MNEFCSKCSYVKNDSINPPLLACPLCGNKVWMNRPPDWVKGARQLPDGDWTIDYWESSNL